MRPWIPKVAILVSTLSLGVILVSWADGQFQSFERKLHITYNNAWPPWLIAMNRTFRRIEQVWPWACLAVTAGSGVVVLDPRTWRRSMEPTTIIVLAALAASVLAIADYQAWPSISTSRGASFAVGMTLSYRVPGAILGAWVVTFGRKMGWRSHLITWMWMAIVILKFISVLLFG